MTIRSRPLEKAFQAKVVKALKTLPNTWYVKTNDRVMVGIPDILASVHGHFVALELKRDEKSKPTPLQLHTLQMIRDTEATALVAYPENWKEIFQYLESLAGGKA